MESLEKQLEIIKRGATEIIQETELVKKIERSIKTKKPLRIKAGFDPTVGDIHLGHTVLLRKLKHFQDLGHEVIFLIGDATALVGDPSGQSKTRKTLTWDEVEKNAKTYVKQVNKILETKNDKVFKLERNSKWFSKPHFAFDEFVELAKRYTVARLLERDDFQKRLKENKPISFLELFYPLMQGFDSVVLKSDVELGGTDQKFNMLVGRNLQTAYGQEPQVVMTMPLLEGTDGVDKMSKSLGNYIGIDEKPKEIFGKIMSISDELMIKYYELLTNEPMNKLKSGLADGRLHPKEAKKTLAKIIITEYYNEKAAKAEEADFEKAFKEKLFPDNVGLKKIKAEKLDIASALSSATGQSKSEIRRKLAEGAIEISGKKEKDPNKTLSKSAEYKIRIGKRFFRILFE
ncbi:MAG: tyrosine--tRNA ligase [Candidatus Omnitrophica bacterium]|nr:tyrosine--tRNA ligase [Candidatus Omnitrophota bacterium]